MSQAINDEWERRLLEAAKRSNEDEEKEFLRLVDMAEDNCSLDTVRTLMKTFSDRPDYGIQERVVSVFATAKEEDVTRGILEELPRLVVEGPEWAEVLVGAEVDHRLELLSSIASEMSDHIKDCLRQVIQDEEFVEDFPNARNLRIE